MEHIYGAHNKYYRRPKFTGEQGELFVSLFTDPILKQLAQLHWVEGKSFNLCAEEMPYCKREIERKNTKLKDVAIAELMKLVSSDQSNIQKLLEIKKIVCSEGEEI